MTVYYSPINIKCQGPTREEFQEIAAPLAGSAVNAATGLSLMIIRSALDLGQLRAHRMRELMNGSICYEDLSTVRR